MTKQYFWVNILKVISNTKRHRLAQISMFLKKTEFTLLKFTYLHFEISTKQMLVIFLNKIREKFDLAKIFCLQGRNPTLRLRMDVEYEYISMGWGVYRTQSNIYDTAFSQKSSIIGVRRGLTLKGITLYTVFRPFITETLPPDIFMNFFEKMVFSFSIFRLLILQKPIQVSNSR